MGVIKLFSIVYDKTITWSGHRHAHYYLAGISFAESSFFPIPPDVMLLSMGLARPHRSWHYALIATLFSVLGGLLGYVLGFYGMKLILPFILSSSYAHFYYKAVDWFSNRGVWMVVLAGFTPFPYKVFTITAGAMHMALAPFMLGSLIGRGGRFFLVCAIMYFTGARIEAQLRRYIDWIGWSLLVILTVAFCVYKWVI